MRGQEQPIGTIIKLPNGYFNQKTEEGWKLRHYIVMEEVLGRPIEKGERVYFVNKAADKCYPDPDDLEVRQVRKKTLRAREHRINQLKKELRQLLEEAEGEDQDRDRAQ